MTLEIVVGRRLEKVKKLGSLGEYTSVRLHAGLTTDCCSVLLLCPDPRAELHHIIAWKLKLGSKETTRTTTEPLTMERHANREYRKCE